jgi:hypothetical protein
MVKGEKIMAVPNGAITTSEILVPEVVPVVEEVAEEVEEELEIEDDK